MALAPVVRKNEHSLDLGDILVQRAKCTTSNGDFSNPANQKSAPATQHIFGLKVPCPIVCEVVPLS
jgi:hypothetical protein